MRKDALMSNRAGLNLDVDLQRGVVPISKAASSLAALIKRAGVTGQPVIVTQKGYPTGVLLPIEVFAALKGMADQDDDWDALPTPKAGDAVVDAPSTKATAPEVAEEAPPEAPKAQRRRRRAEVVA
jgi:prevent-host-death family protein